MNLENGRARLSFKVLKQAPPDPMKQAGDELVATFGSIEEAWKKAEAKLAPSHVPVDVRVEVASGSIGSEMQPWGHFKEFLGYCKLKNQWRICWIREAQLYHEDPGSDEEYECKPVTDCHVALRLEMLDHFEKLYQEVMKVTKDYVPTIKEKLKKFEATLEFIDL